MKNFIKHLLFFILGFVVCYFLTIYSLRIETIEKTQTGELLTITLFNNDFEYYIEY